MHKLNHQNSYLLLLCFLAPNKSEQLKQHLIELAQQQQIHWEHLLFQANIQLCTPLWYYRMLEDELLIYLPEDLAVYLKSLYQENLARNQQMLDALNTLLDAFSKQNIACLLLKGSAIIIQQTPHQLGQRILGDLDILIDKKHLTIARQLLNSLGYLEIPDEDMQADNLPTDERHHQLPRYYLPGTAVVVEIHFKLSYAQVGRMLPTKQAWKNAQPMTFNGNQHYILGKTDALILNTAHALIPHQEFIRGNIPIRQLYDFATMSKSSNIDWSLWYQSAIDFKQTKAFACYYYLAKEHLLEHMLNLDNPIPKPIFHLKRTLFIANIDARLDTDTISTSQWIRKFFYQLYYYSLLPLWVWNNPCYAKGIKNFPYRVFFLFKKVLKLKSWQKAKH